MLFFKHAVMTLLLVGLLGLGIAAWVIIGGR